MNMDLKGDLFVICKGGENDLPWLAKKIAAKDMYEVITGNEFRLRATPMGCDVLGFPQMRLLGFDPQITNLVRNLTCNLDKRI